MWSHERPVWVNPWTSTTRGPEPSCVTCNRMGGIMAPMTSGGGDGAADASASAAATFCETLVDEWVRGGVTTAVVAPGSRSTPLAVALLRNGRIRVEVVLDERSASFMALGTGLATGRPAVLLCTSGTAAAQFHAAVVEADQAAVPLLVCTADRPPELQGVGAPQTIEQVGLYGGSVRWATSPGVPDLAQAGSWRSLAAQALLAATGDRPGPVHLNLAFREPLLGVAVPLPTGRAEGRPWLDRVVAAPSTLHPELLDDLVRRLAGRRVVVVAGGGCVAGTAEAVHGLAEAANWPVLADPAQWRLQRAPLDGGALGRAAAAPRVRRPATNPRSCCASARRLHRRCSPSGWRRAPPTRSCCHPSPAWPTRSGAPPSW